MVGPFGNNNRVMKQIAWMVRRREYQGEDGNGRSRKRREKDKELRK